ncbi:unnamed protein product [Laminaria digitata]
MAVSPGGVRLGRVKNLRFSLSSVRCGKSTKKRKGHFDLFITETLQPSVVWHAVEELEVILRTTEDFSLIKGLQAAHDKERIDVEVQATFDPATNSGAVSLEVILLKKLFNGGTRVHDRSTVDFFTPIVQRLALQQGGSPPIVSLSAFFSSTTSAASSPNTLNRSSEKNSSSTPPPSTAPRESLANGKAHGEAPVAGSAGPSTGERPATSEAVPAGRVGRRFTASSKGYGGRASLDVTLSGLLDSLSEGQKNDRIRGGLLFTPAKVLTELENLQHTAVVEQPACLTVQLVIRAPASGRGVDV